MKLHYLKDTNLRADCVFKLDSPALVVFYDLLNNHFGALAILYIYIEREIFTCCHSVLPADKINPIYIN